MNTLTLKSYDSNQINNLPNDLQILYLNYINCDITNLPPSLEEIHFIDPYSTVFTDEPINHGKITKYQLKLPYGCKLFVNDNEIINFCGFAQVITLEFWFNQNPGLAIPLVALQYNPVKLDLIFE
jgi:hypothetical protein